MRVEMPDGSVIDAPENATKQQVMALYEQQKPKAIQSVGDEVSGLDYAKGLTRSLVEGQTFGFGDEIGLGIAALPASLMTGDKYGDVYGQMRQTYNKEQAEFERQNPKTALAANVAGGLMTGVPGAKAIMTTSRAMANPIKAASLMGAGVGGVSGAGFAPTMEDVPKYAAIGAGAGAVLPPAMAVAGKVLSPIGSSIKNMFTLRSPQTTAAKTTSQFLGQDNIPLSELAESMKKMGGQSTLADVGGENIKGMARAVGQLQGQGKDVAKKMFESRQSGSFNRLIGSIKKLSGGDTKYFENMQNAITRRREQAAPLYKEAETMAIDGNEAQALANSVKQIGNEFEPAARYLKKFMKKNSDGTSMPKMSMKELHSLQRELRDDINKAYKAGSGELGASLKLMRTQLLESMDKVGRYGEARSLYAGESSVMDAMKLGTKVLSKDFDEMAHTVGKMSRAEQEGFINGALKSVRDKLMTSKGDKNAATKLASQAVRERLRTAFPDDDTYKSFINQLDVEDDFARTYQNIYGGSQTQPRQVGAEELLSATKGGSVIKGQDTASYLVNAVKNVTGRDNIPQPVVDELQRILFTPLKQLSNKDWKILRRHNISQKQAQKIQGLIPSIGGVAVVEGGAGAASK